MNLGFSEEISGSPSYFVEKIWASINQQPDYAGKTDYQAYKNRYKKQFGEVWEVPAVQIKPKLHTIRQGKRWQAGEPIHFTINRNSITNFQFAPDLKCQSVQDIAFRYHSKKVFPIIYIEEKVIQLTENQDALYQLAINDGFASLTAFFAYFNTDFVGQIVHWTEMQY